MLTDDQRKLCEDHWNIVHSIARQKIQTLANVELDDLVQWGSLGLIDAAIKYKPGKGPFHTYAYGRISGAIMDGVRENFFWGRSGNKHMEGPESLDYVSEDFNESLPVVYRYDYDGKLDAKLRAKEYYKKIRKLSEQRRQVVFMRTGLDMEFKKIGEYFGITESGAHQIFNMAIKRIKKAV